MEVVVDLGVLMEERMAVERVEKVEVVVMEAV